MAFPNETVRMLMPDNSIAVRVQLGVIDVDFITKDATISVDAFDGHDNKVYTFKFPYVVEDTLPIPNHDEQWAYVMPAIREYEAAHPAPVQE